MEAVEWSYPSIELDEGGTKMGSAERARARAHVCILTVT